MEAAISSPHVIPQPWDYNPSAWGQRIPIAGLAFVAFLIAGYLSAYQWGWVDSAWDPIFGNQTQRVLDSSVSEAMRRWMRIPDGVLGAIAYLSDAVFALAGSTRRWQYRPWLVVLFGIDIIPVGGVSAFLVLVQAFVLGEYCFLCMITAAISLALVYFAYDEVWSCLLYLRRVWKKTHDKQLFWDVFWGRARREGDEIAKEMVKVR